MATRWTDATLFESDDVVLPQILTNVTTKNYHAWVKTQMGYYLNYYFGDYKEFDIEEITAASITALQEPALTLNLHKIFKEQTVNALDDDTYLILRDRYKDDYREEMKMLCPSLEFDEPDGINDRKIFTRPVSL